MSESNEIAPHVKPEKVPEENAPMEISGDLLELMKKASDAPEQQSQLSSTSTATKVAIPTGVPEAAVPVPAHQPDEQQMHPRDYYAEVKERTMDKVLRYGLGAVSVILSIAGLFFGGRYMGGGRGRASHDYEGQVHYGNGRKSEAHMKQVSGED